MVLNIDDPRFIPGIDNCPYLQFGPDTAAHARFRGLRGREPGSNKIFDMDWLDSAGERDRAMDILGGDDSPWLKLFTTSEPAHRQLYIGDVLDISISGS